MQKNFNLVAGARNEVIDFIKNNLNRKILPKTKDVEMAARDYLKKAGVEKYFTHGAGHSLGITKIHGTYFRFSKKTKSRMKINIPFTIEPGLYFGGEYGLRSEMNCYINNDYKLVITTKVQDEIIKI
jgi:Xaa-Pro aminopeptidase